MKNTRYNGKTRGELNDMWMQRPKKDNSDSLDRMRRSLRQARDTELTPRQAELLRLYFEEGKSMHQIAREQGVTTSTVSRTIARAQRRLQRCLQYGF